MPESLQRSSGIALTETEAPISSLQDLFEQATLFTLMPNSFKGLLAQKSTDPLNAEQDLHHILSQEALKMTAKDAEQANTILANIPGLNISGTNVDTQIFCESESEQPDYNEGMAQKPESFKENIDPNEPFPHSRIRREGTGRVSSRRPFTLNSSSFGSDINVQKDPRTLEDVYEFFSAAERQETAAAIIRKLRGENSPVAFCSQQSLKRRVRRQGTGRRKISKNFDWKLLGNTEKYMQLDDEELEVEEEEDPRSSFMSKAEQAFEMLIETDDRTTNKDVQLDSNSQNCKQAHDQHSMANGSHIDGLQPNPVQEKETHCASETEETVNMPPKTSLSFGNSTRNALDQLLKDYMKQDPDQTKSMSFSRSRHEINDIEMPYAIALDCDTKYAFQQSQTESSNTIYSEALFTDEGKTSMQLQQFPKGFQMEVSDRTPHDNACQKPTENSTPLTSPTPPSKISAAFLLHGKLKSGIGVKIGEACKPSIEKRDEEAAKVHSSLHISRSLHNSSPSHSSSPSHNSRRLHISSPPHSSRRFNTSSPSHISRKLTLKSPLKKGESSGVRRLSFDSSSKSTKQDDKEDGFDNGESLNVDKVMDIANPSKDSENDKHFPHGEMETTDVDVSNLTAMSPQKSTPVMGTEVQDFNVLVPEYTEKDALGSASGKQIEEAPVALRKKNVKKSGAKRQSKNNSKVSGCDAHEKDTVISNEIVAIKRKNKKSDYQRRQSLAGAGTLWKSGVRRSTRIRSRPLEFWRGERFLYGRIHNTLATVIGIKYTSPSQEHEKRRDGPNFKVKSYVDDQYSHLVEFAASH
ncbi:hypothetical protein SUGI_0638640 [Cryptomeria japonica]|uniref:centromere protein C isoform X2 n=1 Tax=Cryptomeria japonica TaxID=3369 RepID=UPI0024147130|nr:centromere protein C isoform X2 [Cryptomeria japonica]GLJ31750.1 hypothetical protein SUGI_0638640 [Cryptomeria japonica]